MAEVNVAIHLNKAIHNIELHIIMTTVSNDNDSACVLTHITQNEAFKDVLSSK